MSSNNGHKRPYIIDELKKKSGYIILVLYCFFCYFLLCIFENFWLAIILTAGLGAISHSVFLEKLMYSAYGRNKDKEDNIKLSDIEDIE